MKDVYDYDVQQSPVPTKASLVKSVPRPRQLPRSNSIPEEEEMMELEGAPKTADQAIAYFAGSRPSGI